MLTDTQSHSFVLNVAEDDPTIDPVVPAGDHHKASVQDKNCMHATEVKTPFHVLRNAPHGMPTDSKKGVCDFSCCFTEWVCSVDSSDEMKKPQIDVSLHARALNAILNVVENNNKPPLVKGQSMISQPLVDCLTAPEKGKRSAPAASA